MDGAEALQPVELKKMELRQILSLQNQENKKCCKLTVGLCSGLFLSMVLIICLLKIIEFITLAFYLLQKYYFENWANIG